MRVIPRTEPGEYAPDTVEYFQLVPGEDVLQHITDDERVYAYRTLRFGRNDPTELPSFNQEVFVAFSGANDLSLASLLDEYVTVRAATRSLFDGLPEAAPTRVGIATGNPTSVRAATFHIAGHELHHLDSIRVNYEGKGKR